MSALSELAAQLRGEGTPISPHVAGPDGDRAFAPPGERADVIEAVREGYLLHYAESRLLTGHDEDLALLAGDYLYALDAVLVLADLIGACAQLHAEGRDEEASGRWSDAVGALEAGAATT